MQKRPHSSCPDCDGALSRRDFVRTVGGAALAAGLGPALLSGSAHAAPKPSSAAETTVKRFYDTLAEKQRETICLPWDHKARQNISANWHVTKPEIGTDFYTEEQRKLIDDIVRGVTSEEGYEKVKLQMSVDAGGIGNYSVAVFGEPGSGKSQFLMTGRHLTMRADGDSVEDYAFGGPIIYGHGEENPKDNLFYPQTKKANEVFAALDAKQREKALVEKAPNEAAVLLQGAEGKFPGLTVGEMSSDQKGLVEEAVKNMLSPYRTEDVEEALAILKQGGGFEKLHMAFYKQGDLNNDQEWDIWRVEGPSFVWHFRGAPHVHTYVNIGLKG